MLRLKSRAQFQAVLTGQKIGSTAHFALHRCLLDPSHPESVTIASATKPALFAPPDVWLGAMVPKRWAKRAVTRNAIKRQIYIVSSEFESAFPVAAYVVRLRSGFDRSSFLSASSTALKSAVRNELLALFSSAFRLSHAISPTDRLRW